MSRIVCYLAWSLDELLVVSYEDMLILSGKTTFGCMDNAHGICHDSDQSYPVSPIWC